MKIKVLLLKDLAQEGIQHIFMVPGGLLEVVILANFYRMIA